MPPPKCQSVELKYGAGDCFRCDVAASRFLAQFHAPLPCPDLQSEIERALRAPVNFPSLNRAAVSGDRVVLALDSNVSEPASIIAAVWTQIESAGVEPESVTVIQAGRAGSGQLPDPRTRIQEGIRDRVAWIAHDPEDDDSTTYLASSSNGERIYLARSVVEADVIVTIGQMSFDPLLGYRGTHSVFYPGLSNVEAAERTRGQGHRELGPDDERPLRQLIDEIGWLTGTQFTVQTIPAAGGGTARVIAGAADAVLKAGRELLKELWTIRLLERPEIVVAAVDGNRPGENWQQIGAALETAGNLVMHGGKILILCEADEGPAEGVGLVRESREPTDVIQTLRAVAPPDLVPATQLSFAAGWADVYLLSRLESELVEDLFMVPIENHSEALRLVDGDATCVFLESAEFVLAEVGQ